MIGGLVKVAGPPKLLFESSGLVNQDSVLPVVEDVGVAAEKDVADAVIVKHRDVLHGFRDLPFGIGHFDLGIRKPVLVAGVIVEIAAVAPFEHFGNPWLTGYLLGDGNAVGSCMEQAVERLALHLQRDIH